MKANYLFCFFYAILPISGVIAASVWGGLWPEMQQNIVVGSSLYDASTKVRQPLKISPPPFCMIKYSIVHMFVK